MAIAKAKAETGLDLAQARSHLARVEASLDLAEAELRLPLVDLTTRFLGKLRLALLS